MVKSFLDMFKVSNERDALVLLVLAFSFFLPLSISVAQPFAYVAVGLWLVGLKKGRWASPRGSPFVWPVALFFVVVLVAALAGPRPEFTIPRSRRFLLLPMIFIMGGLFEPVVRDSRRSILAPLLMFVAGSSLLGLWDSVRVPLEVSHGIGLYDAGNMRDPQLYLISACIILAVWIYRPIRLPPILLTLIIAVNLVGMVLHFKRGVWISFVVTALLVTGLTRRFRILAGIVIGVVILFCFPQTRDRIDLLHEEIQEATGGRLVLWTKVAPAMLKDHPLGVGFRGFEHDDFVSYSPVYLQPGLNHLHNNVLQVAVDFGWLGALIWIGWMGWALYIMAKLGRKYRRDDPVRATVGLACLSAFIGLMINGMVEYNFGNSVIFMSLVWLIGLTGTLLVSDRAPEVSTDQDADRDTAV